VVKEMSEMTLREREVKALENIAKCLLNMMNSLLNVIKQLKIANEITEEEVSQ
jgi:hypothetical protein